MTDGSLNREYVYLNGKLLARVDSDTRFLGSKIGTFRNGIWYVDRNGDGVWGGEGIDQVIANFGGATDLPVTADIDDDGTFEIGVFRPSTSMWYFDLDNDGWTGCEADAGTDRCLGPFGGPGDLPVAGDIDNDGTAEIGVFRPTTGQWYFDLDNDGWTMCLADSGTDLCAGPFGTLSDKPVLGDWNNDGTTAIGVFRGGAWFIGTLSGALDKIVPNMGINLAQVESHK